VTTKKEYNHRSSILQIKNILQFIFVVKTTKIKTLRAKGFILGSGAISFMIVKALKEVSFSMNIFPIQISLKLGTLI
jgi:hypothetical protein